MQPRRTARSTCSATCSRRTAITPRRFRDDSVLPPAKLLEMATMGGARALSMESEIGSLEPGKRADIILVNMRQPHLWPPVQPSQRRASRTARTSIRRSSTGAS
ncbi:amidohydrolase family protein [Mesorhizobium sp. B2-3-11]|uniref:amidohydrolase family protein n=1 Tax=Mesorhizobium sp. B2-3-11 TaxID=2589953 RepID=UPI002484B289|nr:amidohydrolase family protein [Mesorhizobium sp. B2-3-11]